MLNYIAINFLGYAVRSFLMDQGGNVPQSAKIDPSVQLTTLIKSTRFHTGILIAVGIFPKIPWKNKLYAANGLAPHITISNVPIKTVMIMIKKISGKSGADTIVRLLSGGNQQKLIIARELSKQAKLSFCLSSDMYETPDSYRS